MMSQATLHFFTNFASFFAGIHERLKCSMADSVAEWRSLSGGVVGKPLPIFFARLSGGCDMAGL